MRDEVGDAAAGTAEVVRQDHVGLDVPGRAVHEHRGDTRLELRFQIPVVVAGRDHHKTVHPPRAQGQHQLLLAFRVLRAGAVDQQGAVRAGHLLDRPAQRPVERVRQVLEDQADAGRTALAQHPRAVVAAETEGVDRLLDPPLRLRGDPRLPVHHPGDRLEPDSGACRDVLHGRPGAVARCGSEGGLGHGAVSCPVVHGGAAVLGLYEDVASSIEPGQRCQDRGRLSTAISGPRARAGPVRCLPRGEIRH